MSIQINGKWTLNINISQTSIQYILSGFQSNGRGNTKNISLSKIWKFIFWWKTEFLTQKLFFC